MLTFIVVTSLLKFLLLALGFALPLATLLTWMERRQSAYSQDRRGPELASFLTIRGRPLRLLGLLHPLADGLKTFFKESFTPASADVWLFRVAPLLGFVSVLVVLALIPFGPTIPADAVISLLTALGVSVERAALVVPQGGLALHVAPLDAGVLCVLAAGSLGVYGVALAGWASNNRFALLGSMRATAQVISYEIALGLSLVGILIAFGTTDLGLIVDAQAGTTWAGLPKWGLFYQPLAAMLFLVAAMAETKRTPFDLPEGESEIIGYFMEYASMSFGMFLLGEFLEIVVLSMLFTTLFLGGWHLPWFVGETSLYLGFASITLGPWAAAFLGMLVFGAKVFLMSAFQLQVRWSLPRFRYDQLMRLGWKSMLPLVLLNIAVTAGLVWWDPSLDGLFGVGLFVVGCFALVVISGPRKAVAFPHPIAHGSH